MRICQNIGFSRLIMRDEQNIPPHIHMHTHICSCVLRCFSCAQLFATLWIMAHQVPLSMGFPGQKDWSELPCPPPGDLPDPGIQPVSLMSPALAGGFFITSTIQEAQHTHTHTHTHTHIHIIPIMKRWSYIYSVDWTIRIMKDSIFWQWKSA